MTARHARAARLIQANHRHFPSFSDIKPWAAHATHGVQRHVSRLTASSDLTSRLQSCAPIATVRIGLWTFRFPPSSAPSPTMSRRICARFGDDYWTECDSERRASRRIPSRHGRCGLARASAMPQELGGAGLGVTEAAIMMHAVATRRRRLCGGVRRSISTSSGRMPSSCTAPTSRRQRMAGAADRGRARRPASASPSRMPVSTRPASRPSRDAPMTATSSAAGRSGRRRRRKPTRSCCSRARRQEGRRQAADRRHDAVLHRRSTARRSRCAASRRWAAPRWIRTRCSSTICSCRTKTASARKARASAICSTASIPNAS